MTKILILMSFLLLTSCSSIDSLNKPVSEFREASKTVVIKSKDYFLSMNRLERDFKFLEISSDKGKEIDDSVTKAVFPAEGIQARLKALAIIDLYTARLVEIVSSDPDEKLTKNVDVLSESLKNMSTVISKISGDGTIKEYTHSIVPLVGVVVSIWAEQERKKALKQAVEIASPEVEKILFLLEQDLKKASEYRKEYLLLRYNDLRKKYNENKSNLSETERKNQVSELKFLYDSYEVLLSLAPEEVISSMRQAHIAFVKLAQDLKDKQKLKAFISSVNILNAKVNEASMVYQTFKSMIR